MPEEFIILESKLNNHSIEELEDVEIKYNYPLLEKISDMLVTDKYKGVLNKMAYKVAEIDSKLFSPKGKCFLSHYYHKERNHHIYYIRSKGKKLAQRGSVLKHEAYVKALDYCMDNDLEIIKVYE